MCSIVVLLASVFGAAPVNVPIANSFFNPYYTWNATGVPHDFGDWYGDRAIYIEEENGVFPVRYTDDGPASMVKFISSLPAGQPFPSRFGTCETMQLVPITSIPGYNPALTYRVTLSALFTRIQRDDFTDTEFVEILGAFTGSPSGFTNTYGLALAVEHNEQNIDPYSEKGWQKMSVTLDVPVGTSYLSLLIGPTENVYNDTTGDPEPEFDGHYCNAVFVTAVPIPEVSPLIFSATVALGLICGFRRGWA